MNIAAQVVGFIGTIILFISYQQNTQKRIMLCHIMASGVFIIHFLMLGLYTGAAMNIVGICRATVYSQRDKKWANSPIWMYFFATAFAVAGIITYENPWSILPTVAMVLSSVSFFLKNPKKIRLLTFPALPMWLIYNVVNLSYAGIITECMNIISMSIAIVRYDILKKEEKMTA